MHASLRAQPNDRTKTEHVGMLDKVIWSDADQPVSILALTDGRSVVIDAAPTAFSRGIRYRFLGRWEEGKRGPQFRAGSYIHDEPHSRVGVVKYLTSVCCGVGEKTADKLWVAYGTDAVKLLREEPDRIATDGHLSIDAARDAARDLARFAGVEKTRVDLFGLFSGRGFPGKLVEHALSKWGAAAPDVIRRCPFRLLMARLPGCGFKRTDKLFLDMGGKRTSLKRQALAGWNALREDRTGSTWLAAESVVKAIEDAVPGAANPVEAIRLAVRGGLVRVLRDGPRRWVAAADHARAEQRVADAVARLRRGDVLWPIGQATVSVAQGDGLPSVHQRLSIALATRESIGCYTGGPGTGKTHSLSFLLHAIVRLFGESSVCVAAPTGKASVRTTQALADRGLGLRATTIHQLLEIGRNGHDGQGWGFERNRNNPLAERFVIVDEASMIDTSLMADLLDACGDGTQVLFVGDPFQLAPVGHGAPLRDFLAANVAGGELSEVRRNAGWIVRACAEIKLGRRPAIADTFDLDSDDPKNLRFAECRTEETVDFIESTLLGMKRFDPVWDCQILVATNDKSDVSRKAVNARLGKVLNPDGRRVPGIPFAVGDKVICTRNSRLTSAHTFNKGSEDATQYSVDCEAEVYVANGEIGRVQAIGPAGMVFAASGKLVWVPKSKPRPADDEQSEADTPSGGGAMGDFEPAWAVTGHKSQGSEWPVVIVVADKAGAAVADRNWWYTAISRAAKACLIVGDKAAFEAQCRRQSLALRKTYLAELILASTNPTHTEATP